MNPHRSITTGQGDQGTTRLFSGEEVPKDHARTEAYGDADELCSILGVARASSTRADIREAIVEIQRDLFVVNTELATGRAGVTRLAQRVDTDFLAAMERQRSEWEKRINMPPGFVIPGGTPAAGFLDLARTVARRCERRVVGLLRSGELDNEHLLVWMNRLSDYLWILARAEEGDQRLVKDA